jgi:hypothetical protein
MSWFNIIKDCGKKHTKQTKLPKELTDGATVSNRPLKDWFKDKKRKDTSQPADDTTRQVKMPFHIDVGEEE